MKLLLALLTTASLPIFTNGQNIVVDTANKLMDIEGSVNGAEIHLPVVKKLPSFETGRQDWHNFLRININSKVPLVNKAKPGVYNVIARFIIGSNGQLHSIRAVSNCGSGMENELIKAITKSKPWQPAETAAGKKVSYTLQTIVSFTVSDNDVLLKFN